MISVLWAFIAGCWLTEHCLLTIENEAKVLVLGIGLMVVTMALSVYTFAAVVVPFLLKG